MAQTAEIINLDDPAIVDARFDELAAQLAQEGLQPSTAETMFVEAIKAPNEIERQGLFSRLGQVASNGYTRFVGAAHRGIENVVGVTARGLGRVNPRLANLAPAVLLGITGYAIARTGSFDFNHLGDIFTAASHGHGGHGQNAAVKEQFNLMAEKSGGPTKSPSPSTTDLTGNPNPNKSTPAPTDTSSPSPSGSPSPSASDILGGKGQKIDHGQNPGAVGSQPDILKKQGQTVTVLDAKDVKHVTYAGGPDQFQDTHFVKTAHGTVIKMEGLTRDGTTLNGHNLTPKQMQNLRVAVEVNVNGQPKFIEVKMNEDGELLVPGKLGKLVENYKFNELRIVVPSQHAGQMNVISTVVGKGNHNYSAKQIANLTTDYDTFLQHHGSSTTVIQGQESSAIIRTHDSTTFVNGAEPIHGGSQVELTFDHNHMGQDGQFYADLTTPSVASFKDGHWVVAHAQMHEFQQQLNEQLREHNLWAQYHVTQGAHDQDSVDRIDIFAFKNNSDALNHDVILAHGYDMTPSANHESLYIHVPAHDGVEAQTIEVNTKGMYHNGEYDLNKLQPAIAAALKAHGVSATFHNHEAAISAAAANGSGNGSSPDATSSPSESPKTADGTSSPQPTDTNSPSSTDTGTGGGGGSSSPDNQNFNLDNNGVAPDWLREPWPYVVGAVAVAGLYLGVNRVRQGENSHISRGVRAAQTGMHVGRQRTQGGRAERKRRAEERETAKPTAEKALLVQNTDEQKSRVTAFLDELRSDALTNEPADNHDVSEKMANDYATIMAHALRTPDQTNDQLADAIGRHLTALGVIADGATVMVHTTPDGGAEVRMPDGVDDAAARPIYKHMASELNDRFATMPDPQALYGNAGTVQVMETLLGPVDNNTSLQHLSGLLAQSPRPQAEIDAAMERIRDAVSHILVNLATHSQGREQEVIDRIFTAPSPVTWDGSIYTYNANDPTLPAKLAKVLTDGARRAGLFQTPAEPTQQGPAPTQQGGPAAPPNPAPVTP